MTNMTTVLKSVALAAALSLTPAFAQTARFSADYGSGMSYNEQNLVRLVRSLGYEFSDLGDSVYMIPFTRGGIKFNVKIFLSDSKSKVWLTVYVADAQKVPSNVAPKLLAKNADISPSRFELTDGRLNITRPIDNRDLTVEEVKDAVERIVQAVVDTKDLWQTRL